MKLCLNILTEAWPTMPVAKAMRHSLRGHGLMFGMNQSKSNGSRYAKMDWANQEASR
jgi:hypothetical protein